MTSFLAENRALEPAGARFRALLERRDILRLPGAYNGLSALQAKGAGFEALYLSGAAMSASMGLPDLGVITIEDVCFFIRQMARASDLPILVDGDTGYGEALNVMHMVRSFEEAGAGAVHIEDQILPKKCGHLNDKRLASPQEMAEKIAAARKARRHLYIIARTDAVASEGMDSRIDAPLLANMTEFGRTPFFTADQFESFGFKMVIWPVTALRLAAGVQRNLYAELAARGTAEALVPQMMTRAELYETIRYFDFEELDKSIATTVLP